MRHHASQSPLNHYKLLSFFQPVGGGVRNLISWPTYEFANGRVGRRMAGSLKITKRTHFFASHEIIQGYREIPILSKQEVFELARGIDYTICRRGRKNRPTYITFRETAVGHRRLP